MGVCGTHELRIDNYTFIRIITNIVVSLFHIDKTCGKFIWVFAIILIIIDRITGIMRIIIVRILRYWFRIF